MSLAMGPCGIRRCSAGWRWRGVITRHVAVSVTAPSNPRAQITTFFLTQHFTSASTQVRGNSMWSVLFTTTSEVALKHMEDEMANDFCSPQDFRAFVDLNTKDHKCIIISQWPDMRGVDRYWSYLAKEPPRPFVLLCDRAWGGNRFEKCAKQREQFKEVPKYAVSTLERMFRQERSQIRREHMTGNTPQYKRATDVRPFELVA